MAKMTVIILDGQKMDRDERWVVTHGSWCEPKETVAAGLQAIIESGRYKTYEVEAADIDDVFAILNGAPGTTRPASYRERSMSVGDIVIDENGTAHVCASAGWTLLQDLSPEAARLLAR